MATRYKNSPASKQLRWVVLLLVIAVILPSVCLLWFMTQAVKNERLAVRQKLIDVYTKRSQYFFIEVPDQYFNTKIKHLNSLTSQDPYAIFNAFAIQPGDQFAGMLVFDANNNLAYPVLNTFTSEYPDKLIEPFQEELKGNLEEAIKQYEKIAEGAETEILRYKSILSQSRCLVKLDRKKEAIALTYELSYPPDFETIKPELAAVVMHSRVFLAELYKETKDENLYYHLRRILGNSHYNNEKESGFLSGPAETIIWQLDKLINMAQQAGLSDKLERGIESAKSRMEAYQNAIWAASIYPDVKALNTWPDHTIKKLSPESDLHGLKFKLADKIILGISSADRMLKILNAVVSDMQDDMVSVQVYNNFGQRIAGDDNFASKPFLTLSPSKYLPEFEVAVYFRETDVFENAASKQTSIYIWTGILVVLLILVSGGVATQAIGRQIKLNRLKNDFIATVTHELKTPLSSMRVLVDTMLEGNYNDPKQATEYLQLISKENARLSRLIDNFLTFSRMERNKQAFDIAPVSPAEVAKAAAEAVKTKFNKDNCKFTVTIADALPSILVDKDAMVTVLVNLLDNAFKYSYDDKEIELNVYAEGDSVCFSVKDNGIGMSRRAVKKVFNRFYQADSSLTRQVEGTGLGLSIVKFIVDAHKGKITVDSKPGKGSEFTVALPKAT